MTEKPPGSLPREGVTYHKVEKEGPLNREDITTLLRERETTGFESAAGAVATEGEHPDSSEHEETDEAKKARELKERLAKQEEERKAAEAKKPAQAKAAPARSHGGHHGTFGTGPIAVFFTSLWKMGAYFMKEMNTPLGGGGGHSAPKKPAQGGGGHGH